MSAALRLERVSYRYPGAAAPALRDVDLRVAPGEFVVLAGEFGLGQVDAAAGRVRASCRTSTAASSAAGWSPAGWTRARTSRPQIAAVAGTLFQDPETQVVMGTVRAELAFPLENLGLGAAAVARGVEEAALALGIAPLLDRSTHDALGRRAAARRARRRARRPAARWRCSTSRPRSSTPSPATSCSACCGGSTRSGAPR